MGTGSDNLHPCDVVHGDWLMLDPLLGKHGPGRGVFGAYKSSDMDATCVANLAASQLFDLIVLSSVVCVCVPYLR